VTAIELGDLDRGYRAIDISTKGQPLYSLTCPLMLVPLIMALPKLTKGKLAVVPKNKAGQPLKSKVDALVEIPRRSSAQLMAPKGTVDRSSIAMGEGKSAVHEIKEWQAIMDHLRNLPVKSKGELPVIPVDDRAAEVRAIKESR
jgi:5'-nucleotidase